MRATDLLALAHVPRWAIVPVGRPQSVAEHTFGVMVILLDLPTILDLPPDRYDSDGHQVMLDEDMGALLRAALIHDQEESRSGDLPGPFKGELIRYGGEMALARALIARGHEPVTFGFPWPPFYRPLLKLADLIEALVYLTRWGVGQHAKSILCELETDITAIVDRNWPARHGHVAEYITRLLNDEGRR